MCVCFVFHRKTWNLAFPGFGVLRKSDTHYWVQGLQLLTFRKCLKGEFVCKALNLESPVRTPDIQLLLELQRLSLWNCDSMDGSGRCPCIGSLPRSAISALQNCVPVHWSIAAKREENRPVASYCSAFIDRSQAVLLYYWKYSSLSKLTMWEFDSNMVWMDKI